MCYLHVFEIDLRVVGHLLLMLCCYALSEISMNWFINGGMMEKLAVLGGERGRRLIKWWENISGKGLKIQHQFYQYIGSKIATKSWWGKVLATWILGWIMVSLCTFWHLNSQGIEKRKETLASMCDERARMLQDQFNVSLNHIQALSILISTFHHSKTPSAIDQTTFARYTERTTFERPLTSGVAYAVRVLHSEREEFEKQQGWTIKRMDALEQTPVHEDDYVAEISQTSPVQDEYAPVIFAQETISHVISLDMLSGKEDRENVIRARESGKGVLTAPFRLLKSNRLGVILTFAVYKSELPSNATPNERIQVTDGYLGGVFDIEALVEKLLHQLASKQKILVNVDDTTNTSHPISMYGSNVTEDGMYHTSSLNFGDPFRKHEMCCRFKQKPPWPWQAILTSIGILIIALLLGYICHATVNRIAKVEEDFHKMMELKRLAEAADVAKSQFLATVSHEIRTPMNGVLGMLQMLMDTELDITQQDYVRTAQGSGKALVSLINEVLDQARVESGKLELEAVRFDPRSILDEVLSLFSGKAQKKGIELAVYISDQVPECLIGDPGRFRQIITNLMGNSIKFTDKGHIFVMIHLVEEVMNSIGVKTEASSKNTLSGFPVADRGRSWRGFKSCSQEGFTCPSSFSSKSSEFINLIVSVEDTGTGIPAEAESRVFTPFMQVGPSISRIHGGTGIGLSISKCLVALMKGEIGFASEPQVGSTFTFTAVFTNGHLKLPDQKNQQINKQPKSVPSEFQGMAALVVDPRLVRAKVTRYHLQRLGIHVEVASDLNLGITYLNSRTMIVNMVLVEKEAWEKDHDLSNDFVTKLRDYDHSEPIRLFLLATSIVSTKTSTAKSASYTPIVIMKPLRASMLAASLQRAMGVGNKGTSRNGGLPVQSLENLLHGKLILVVDDNKVNLKVAAGALKKYGAKVECAESGKKAIALLKPPHNFDACFMDIQMPEMDGFEATKRIRNMERNVNDRIQLGEACAEDYENIPNWHVPILAMTADVIQATHEECLKFEMDGYVSKPFEGEQLYREVARFVKSNSAHDQ